MLMWQMSQSPIHSNCDDTTHEMPLRGEALRTEGQEDLFVAQKNPVHVHTQAQTRGLWIFILDSLYKTWLTTV